MLVTARARSFRFVAPCLRTRVKRGLPRELFPRTVDEVARDESVATLTLSAMSAIMTAANRTGLGRSMSVGRAVTWSRAHASPPIVPRKVCAYARRSRLTGSVGWSTFIAGLGLHGRLRAVRSGQLVERRPDNRFRKDLGLAPEVFACAAAVNVTLLPARCDGAAGRSAQRVYGRAFSGSMNTPQKLSTRFAS
jgi:hypothetical protein